MQEQSKNKQQKKKLNIQYMLPRIGFRIIKTAIVVAICLAFSYAFKLQNAPIIAIITAIIGIQQQMEDAVQISLVRVIGTLSGVIFGVLMAYCLEAIIPLEYLWLHYAILSVMIIPVIYTSILLKQNSTGGLAAIVFVCVTLIPTEDSTLKAGLIRATETIGGVMIALFVNRIHLPRRKETDYLFIAKFDQVLYQAGEGLTPFCTFELNQLLRDGIALSIISSRTPAFLQEHMGDVHLKLPVIAMDGAVLYDMEQKKHLIYHGIYGDMVKKIERLLHNMEMNFFQHVIWNDVMFTYYKDLNSFAEKETFEERKKLPHRHYVYGRYDGHGVVIAFILILEMLVADVLEAELHEIDTRNELYVTRDTMGVPEGYCNFKIYDRAVSRKFMAQHLLERTPQEKMILFGGSDNDLELMKAADLSFALKDAPKKVVEHADVIIKGEFDHVGDKIANEIFHTYQPLIWKKKRKFKKDNAHGNE